MSKETKIFTIDFDNTCALEDFPGVGPDVPYAAETLKKLQEQGHKIILWTCRTGELLTQAVHWCNDHSLYFDAVNQNLPEVIEQMGGDSRKIHADIYIDDKSLKDIHLDSIY